MSKDFGRIADDYAFFMTHATEAEHDAKDYARELAEFADGREYIRMLDFGCGRGEFTERLLQELAWPTDNLSLHLVEPVEDQRLAAVKRLAPFARLAMRSAEAITHSARLPADTALPFDIVVSNHSLYYVDNLAETTRGLLALLAPGGTFLSAMASWENALMQVWQLGFGLIDQPVPYYAAEDLTAELEHLGAVFRTEQSHYELRFPDSEPNRLRILRFLLAEHLDEMPRDELLAYFDRYAEDDEIVMRTWSEHVVVGATGIA
jgi:trans-aconitate 2-methyltransferase